jgi:hypothetical protein
MRESEGPKAPRLRKLHVPEYYTTPGSGNMTSVSTKRGKVLGLLRLSKTDFYEVNYINFFFMWRRTPKWTILEVSRSPTTTHHTRNGSSITAHRRDLYLTTLNTHNRKTSMLQARFEPAVSAGDWPQTYASDSAATGTDI